MGAHGILLEPSGKPIGLRIPPGPDRTADGVMGITPSTGQHPTRHRRMCSRHVRPDRHLRTRTRHIQPIRRRWASGQRVGSVRHLGTGTQATRPARRLGTGSQHT